MAADILPRPADVSTATAAVLSVGSELLLGDLTDTNATWISQRLRELGVDVVFHVSVRDDLEELAEAIHFLAARVDIIITGGGLGPTADDLTREAIALAAGVELDDRDDLREALQARFAAMGRTMSPKNLKQAAIPRGATAFPAVGTAPAFALTVDDPTPTRIIALPGVPWELRALFTRYVIDEVQRVAGKRATVTRSVFVAGRGESDVASVIEPLAETFGDVTLAFLAHAKTVEVRVTGSAADPASAHANLQSAVDAVLAALGSAVVGMDDEALEDTVLRLLVERRQTVAFAESATAGDMAARLGRVPGASRALLGGVVAYATDAKAALLGIDRDLIDRHGAVSEEVTVALARAVQERTGADWAVAVTGAAGPDPAGEAPVGLGFWALAGPKEVEVYHRMIPGDRAQFIARLGTAGLDLLRRRLAESG